MNIRSYSSFRGTWTDFKRNGRNRKPRGVTLIELMVTVAILAILLGLAAPSFDSFILSGRLRALSNDMLSSVMLARSEAIKRNSIVRLCASSGGASCDGGSWGNGWIVVASAGGEVIHRHQRAPEGYSVVDEIGNLTAISFNSSGLAQSAADFKVCRKTPTVGDQERIVRVRVGGARVDRPNPSSGSCP